MRRQNDLKCFLMQMLHRQLCHHYKNISIFPYTLRNETVVSFGLTSPYQYERVLVLLGPVFSVDESFKLFVLVLFCILFLVCFSIFILCNTMDTEMDCVHICFSVIGASTVN